MATVPSIMDEFSQNLMQAVSLGIAYHLHYFPAPPEHFLPEVLSQIFAPIPGGPHTTFRWEGQSTFRMEPLSSMIQPSTPTPLTT
jgi:hypothetical protein